MFHRLSGSTIRPRNSFVAIIRFLLLVAAISRALLALNSDDHRRLAEASAIRLQFTPQAAQLLGLAATEPDYYDWSTPAAHAQTPNNQEGVPTKPAALAEADSVQYLQGKASEFLAKLSSGDSEAAVYVLGYALHTVQDYASHRGMTNFDHSYLSFNKHNPDLDPVRIARAGQWTQGFLEAVRKQMSHCAWERIRGLTRTSPPSSSMRLRTIGTDTPTTLIDYEKYWEQQFNDPNYNKNVTWFPLEGTYEALRNAFTSGLRSQDDVAWLFEGEWTGGKGGPVTIKREGLGYQCHRSDGVTTWTLLRTGTQLKGGMQWSEAYMLSEGIQAWAIPQLLGKLMRYLTAVLSEDSCTVDLHTEEDNPNYEIIDGKPTGRVRVEPRGLAANFTLKISE